MMNTTNNAAAETATLIAEETRSQNLRRAALESEMAQAFGAEDEQLIRACRNEIGRCDRALMELGAGRLPRR